MRLRTKSTLIVIAACALVAGALALAGCSVGGGKLSCETIDKAHAYKVTADNVAKNEGLTTSGAFTIEEGEILVVSPDLRSGSLHVRLQSESGDVAFEEDISGQELSTKTVDAGKYAIGITCGADGTAGTLTMVSINADEFDKQGQDLEAILAMLAESEAGEASSPEA